MKRLLVLSLLVLLAFPSLAGGYSPKKFINPIQSFNPPPEIAEEYKPTPRTTEKIIERQIVMKEAKELKPAHGLTLGFLSDYPTIGSCNEIGIVELGARNNGVNKSAMLRIAGYIPMPFYIALPKYTQSRVGIAYIRSSGQKSDLGIFAGLEQYLNNNTALSADVYYITGDSGSYLPMVQFGGKIVI